MTLGRTGLLAKRFHKSKTDTMLVNGYLVRNDNAQVLNVVLFYGNDCRLKGYVNIADVIGVLENRVPKAVVKKNYKSAERRVS